MFDEEDVIKKSSSNFSKIDITIYIYVSRSVGKINEIRKIFLFVKIVRIL